MDETRNDVQHADDIDCGIVTIEVDEDGERLDSFVAANTDGMSRSFAQNLIKSGRVNVDGAPKKANYITRVGQTVTVEIPEPVVVDLIPEDIPLDVVYEDEDIIVVNKQRGMVVHPAVGNATGTLVNALMYHVKDLSGIGSELRPGIVHRIDKDTTGLLVVAKNDRAHRSLSEQIAKKTAARVYLAIVEGNFKDDSGRVDAPIGRSPKDRKKMAVVDNGRKAVTNYRVFERYDGYSLVECSLETGRTHQIRVHMAKIGHSVLGDALYNGRKNRFGMNAQALHAWKLSLVHPTTGERMNFFAPPPDDFLAAIKRLAGGSISAYILNNHETQESQEVK